MFDNRDLVDVIMEHADAVLIVQQVQERLSDEQRKREEFYETIDEDTKAEFVNGEVMYHSPVMKEHNDASGLIYMLLKSFAGIFQLGYVGIEKILTKFTRNDYEPDVCFFNREKSQHIKKGQLICVARNFGRT